MCKRISDQLAIEHLTLISTCGQCPFPHGDYGRNSPGPGSQVGTRTQVILNRSLAHLLRVEHLDQERSCRQEKPSRSAWTLAAANLTCPLAFLPLPVETYPGGAGQGLLYEASSVVLLSRDINHFSSGHLMVTVV